MSPKTRLASFIAVILLASQASFGIRLNSAEIAVPKGYTPPPLARSERLDRLVSSAVTETLASMPDVKPSDVAATLIDLRQGSAWQFGDIRGNERIYPASVVKLFYMNALERQLEDGKITSTPEMMRGLRDMIVVSSNEATQYILDVITGTSSGAELSPKQFEAWQYKRNSVNRFVSAMGYQNINVDQKTFCEDAYGIEQQSRGYNGQNRNMLTTDAVARLMAEIVTGRMNTPERTAAMMTLLRRDPFTANTDPDDQSHGFTGRLFISRKMTDARLWSKAGWTSTARHDVAYVETADGLKFVIAIFTEHHADKPDIIPSIEGRIIDGLRK